jgi:pyrroloquinoline quinone biosynthesis protein D
MIAATAKPRLADKARLRLDPKTGETLLLYPEAGLKLIRTGTHVLERCTGERSVTQIVDELVASYAGADRGLIEREVLGLLSRLVDRGLLVLAS